MTTILVVATLDTCGACHQYNLYEHPQLKYLIKQHAQIRLVEVEGYYDDGKLTLHSDGPIHPAFRSKIKFFPSFYLFTAKTWNDPNQPLSGAAMGLDIDNMIELESEYDPTTDSIWKWIKSSLHHAPFKYSTSITKGLHSPYIPGFGIKNM